MHNKVHRLSQNKQMISYGKHVCRICVIYIARFLSIRKDKNIAHLTFKLHHQVIQILILNLRKNRAEILFINADIWRRRRGRQNTPRQNCPPLLPSKEGYDWSINVTWTVSNTACFAPKRKNKVTFVSPYNSTENQIDHICITKQFRRFLQDVRARRGAGQA